MGEQQYQVRVIFPSGKARTMDLWRPDADQAARAAVWIAYYQHLTFDPKDPETVNVSRLPDGWGRMSEDEKYALAKAAGYRAAA